MELPLTGMISPQLQQTYSAVMEDYPRSPSIISLEDLEEFDPETSDALVEGFFKDCDVLPCPAYTHEGHQLREEEQQQYDHDNIKESREENERTGIKQQELLQRHIPHVSPAALPTESSLERELLEPLPDLDDCNSVEGSLSASTTSTCAAKSGEARGMVAASNASCTTWVRASEVGDDNSDSGCPAPNVITSDIDQQTLDEEADRHRELDFDQPSLNTSTSSQGASQEACGHDSSNLKPVVVPSGAGAPILPFTSEPSFAPIVGSNAVTSVALPPFPIPNPGELAYAATGWKRARNANFDTGSKKNGNAQDGGQPRLLLSSSIRAKGQETGPNDRVNKRTKREARLMKNREAANRSRMKRKENQSELENRAATLSRSLVASREENDSLKQEMASLREHNSFLRGMLSAKDIVHELPSLLPISSINIRQSSGSNGSGRGRTTTAVNAVVGVIGTALPVVSSAALPSTDYEGGGDSVTNSTFGNMASSCGKSGSDRRMILSVDDYDLTLAQGSAAKAAKKLQQI